MATATNSRSRSAARKGSRAPDSLRLVDAGTSALAERCRRGPDGTFPAGEEMWIARWLWLDFEPFLAALDALYADRQADRAELEALKSARLNVTALAVEPRGAARFASALDAFVERWHACVARVAAPAGPGARPA